MSFGSTMQLVRDVATFVIIIIIVVAVTYGYFSWKHQKNIIDQNIAGNNSEETYEDKGIPLISAWFGSGRTCYYNNAEISCAEMDARIMNEYGS